MCYTGSCLYEDWQGECCKPRLELCPLEYPDDDGRDALCDILYEQRRDDALMERMMVTMRLSYKGHLLVLVGSMAEIMALLRAWCPSGKVVEIFDTARGPQ